MQKQKLKSYTDDSIRWCSDDIKMDKMLKSRQFSINNQVKAWNGQLRAEVHTVKPNQSMLNQLIQLKPNNQCYNQIGLWG